MEREKEMNKLKGYKDTCFFCKEQTMYYKPDSKKYVMRCLFMGELDFYDKCDNYSYYKELIGDTHNNRSCLTCGTVRRPIFVNNALRGWYCPYCSYVNHKKLEGV